MLRQFAPCKIRSPGQETLGFFQFAAYSRENPHMLRGVASVSWQVTVCASHVCHASANNLSKVSSTTSLKHGHLRRTSVYLQDLHSNNSVEMDS